MQEQESASNHIWIELGWLRGVLESLIQPSETYPQSSAEKKIFVVRQLIGVPVE